MKRLTALLLVFIMLFALAACGKDSVADGIGATYNREFVHATSPAQVACATEDTVYFVPWLGERIYYIDKATGISGPLCGKPECGHNDTSCNAYFNDVYGMGIDDGSLYVLVAEVGRYVIYSVMLDGTDRQEVRDVDQKIVPSGTSNQHMVVDMQTMYMICVKTEIIGGEPICSFFISALPLDPNEDPFVVLDRETRVNEASYNHIAAQPYGDTLYIVTDEHAYDSTEGADAAYDVSGVYRHDLTVMRWDVEARELTTLYFEESSLLDIFPELWVEDDGIVLWGIFTYEGGTSWDWNLYKYVFESGEMELLVNWPQQGRVRIPTLTNDLVVMSIANDDSNGWTVLIEDYEGSIMVEETHTWASLSIPDGTSYPPFCFGVDDMNAYFYLSYVQTNEERRSGTHHVVFAVPLDGSGIRVMLNETKI